MNYCHKKLIFGLILCAAVGVFAPIAAHAQVNMATPGLFNQLGVSGPSDEGSDTNTPANVTDPAAPVDTPAKVTPPPPPGDKVEPIKPPPPPADIVLAVYIALKGQTTGPFDAAQLRQKVTTGELTPDTFVWMEGMSDWKAAKDVPQLRDILASAPPPPPVTPTFDAIGYLSGVWESGPEPLDVPGAEQAQITGTIEYHRDGKFEGFGTLFLTSQGFSTSMNFTLKGSFELQNISQSGFVISQKGSATYHTPNGPFTEQVSVAFQARIIDQNTLENDKGVRSRRIR